MQDRPFSRHKNDSRRFEPSSLINIALNTYIIRRFPLAITHFITEECNARCAHCFIDFDDAERLKDRLSLDDILKLTKTMGNSLVNVFLTGGEPFLRKDLFTIVEAYFLNAGARSVFITTNGFFKDRIRKLAESFSETLIKGQLFITISIDDFEETHDANRRLKGLFSRAIESYKAVEALQKNNISPNIAITVTPQNSERVVALYHHLREEHGINTITAIAMREEGVVSKIDRSSREKIWKGYEQLTKIISKDMRRKIFSGYRGSILGHFVNAKNMIFYPILRKTFVDQKYVSPCTAGKLYGTIRANGDIYPCEILPKKLGNLRDYQMNFLSAWHDLPARECRRYIRQSKCHCSFECAWSFNIISNYRYLPRFCIETIRSIHKGRRHG
jgi:radical SAM protein with 4Fe4S-binding SPASM domain